MDEIEEMAESEGRNTYINAFYDLAIAFLIRKHVEEHGPEDIEALIESWRASLGETIGHTLEGLKEAKESGLGQIFGAMGILKDESEIHEKADRMMYESEDIIRQTLGLPKDD